MVCAHFPAENEEAIIPFILQKVAFILNNGLIGSKDDPKEKNEASSMVIDVYDKKMNANINNKSMVNLLLGYYIALCKGTELVEMAEKGELVRPAGAINVNKTQRYACIRKLVKFEHAQSEVQRLFEKE